MTWGNTPAYKDGVVYVVSANTPGTIYAYDATAEPNAIKLWEATDASFDSFFGGVTVTKEGFLYAASYYFWEEEDNSSLCKIDCKDGSIVWITQTERTDSMPVVAGDKIYISGGADYMGTRLKVEAYRDDGNSVTKLWETPSSMVVGGWANQPVYANGKLYVGTTLFDEEYSAVSTELYILSVSVTPNDPNFIIAHYNANECGNSPAVTYDNIYTIGSNGLFKFHQPALLSDIRKDGKVDTHDLNELADAWLCNEPIGVKRSDLDLDGDADFADLCVLANEWRKTLD